MRSIHQSVRMLLSISLAIAIAVVWSAFLPPAQPAGARGATQDSKDKGKAEKPAPPEKKDPKPAATKKTPSPAEEKLKPQAVDFATADGVLIAGTYFLAGTGEESPAVILLHGLGRTQRDFDDLAFMLQDSGYAVLTFDLRGHGFSTSLDPESTIGRPQGKVAPKLSYKSFRSIDDFARMLEDLEAAKRYLVRRNNAKELNIAKLAVVGAELGGTLAVNWAVRDWSYPDVGFVKQGKDVRSIVLLSPQINLKGLRIDEAASHLRIPAMVVAGGKETGPKREAERIHQLVRFAGSSGSDSELKLVDTSLQATRLLDKELNLGVDRSIVQYLNKTVKKSGSRWEPRGTDDATSK